jgi:hypothetical protein
MAMAPVRVEGLREAAEAQTAANVVPMTAETLNPRIAAALGTSPSYDFTLTVGVMDVHGFVVDGHDFEMVGTDTGTPVEIRLVGDDLFISSEPVTGGLFVLIDPANADSTVEIYRDTADWLDPTQGVTGVTEAITSVVPVGEPEQLDGVPAQRYDVTFDPARLPPEILAGADPTVQLAYSYWLGPDDRLRKASSVQGGFALQMTFSNYSPHAPVAPPTPDEMCSCSAPTTGV